MFVDIVEHLVNVKYPHSTRLAIGTRGHCVKVYSR
jgi:hypothetical protein